MLTVQITLNEEKHLMRGKKSDLGRNDIKNWKIRSFWGRYSLKWGYLGHLTTIPETKMPPSTSFFNGLGWSGQIYGREKVSNS
jgi:hypothetical protein